MKDVPNPKLFRELSEPIESAEKANELLDGFFNELAEARKKYHLRDVHLIVNGSCLTSDGQGEEEWFAVSHLGNAAKAEAMCAYALGVATKERQEAIGQLIDGKVRHKLQNR